MLKFGLHQPPPARYTHHQHDFQAKPSRTRALGPFAIPNAVLAHLKDHVDMGVHTELIDVLFGTSRGLGANRNVLRVETRFQ